MCQNGELLSEQVTTATIFLYSLSFIFVLIAVKGGKEAFREKG